MKKEYLDLLRAIFGPDRVNMDLIEDNEKLINRLFRESIGEVFEDLTAKESLVLILRFNLTGEYKSFTLKQVGVLFGLTKERIRQIEAKALRKMKHPSRSGRLRILLKS